MKIKETEKKKQNKILRMKKLQTLENERTDRHIKRRNKKLEAIDANQKEEERLYNREFLQTQIEADQDLRRFNKHASLIPVEFIQGADDDNMQFEPYEPEEIIDIMRHGGKFYKKIEVDDEIYEFEIPSHIFNHELKCGKKEYGEWSSTGDVCWRIVSLHEVASYNSP